MFDNMKGQARLFAVRSVLDILSLSSLSFLPSPLIIAQSPRPPQFEPRSSSPSPQTFTWRMLRIRPIRRQLSKINPPFRVLRPVHRSICAGGSRGAGGSGFAFTSSPPSFPSFVRHHFTYQHFLFMGSRPHRSPSMAFRLERTQQNPLARIVCRRMKMRGIDSFVFNAPTIPFAKGVISPVPTILFKN